jgi:hypothetical protein
MSSDEDAFNELCCYTLAHHDPAFIHQHVVDAFAVQQADATTKPIKLTFGLIGLYLKIERQFSGREVQRAHMALARQKHVWPTFPLPRDRGAMNATAVMEAFPGVERDQAIDRWCASVWAAFDESHSMVADLLVHHGIVPRVPDQPGSPPRRR